MELRTLRTFQRVAQLKSFSKAAAALGYTQAASQFRFSSWKRSCIPDCLTDLENPFASRSREISSMPMRAVF